MLDDSIVVVLCRQFRRHSATEMTDPADCARRCAACHCQQWPDRNDRSPHNDIHKSNVSRVSTAGAVPPHSPVRRTWGKLRARATGVRKQTSERRNRGRRKQHRTRPLANSMKSRLSNDKTTSIPIGVVDGSVDERQPHRGSPAKTSAIFRNSNGRAVDAWCKTPNAERNRQWFAVSSSHDSATIGSRLRGGVPTPPRPPLNRKHRQRRQTLWPHDRDREANRRDRDTRTSPLVCSCRS